MTYAFINVGAQCPLELFVSYEYTHNTFLLGI